MKNKKKDGFTLTELIAVIAILALIVLIAIPAYNSIRKRTLETQYKNVIDLIETAAEKYASKTGSSVALVQNLIDAGLIETDDGDNVLDPRDNTSLNCYPIEIEYKRGTYKAKYIEEEISSCDVEDAIAQYSDISIERYDITPTREVLISGETWSSNDSKLEVNLERLSSLSGLKYSWITSRGQTGNASTITISPNTVYNGTVNVQVTDNDNNWYFASTIVRIDKEEPVIEDVSVSCDGDCNNGRKVTIKATDKNGSGIAGYYIGKTRCTSSSSFENSNKASHTFIVSSEEIKSAKPNEDTPATYYVCVKDKVGNITDSITDTQNSIKLDIKDTTPPDCKWDKESTTWASSRTITLTCVDEESGCHADYDSYSRTFNDSNSVIRTQQLSYIIKDNAGNTNTCTKEVNVYVDNKGPECVWDGEAASDTDWAKERNITLNCYDGPDGSGCDDAMEMVGYNILDFPIQIDYNSGVIEQQNGNYFIYDNVGNETKCDEELDVYVDTISPFTPEITHMYEIWGSVSSYVDGIHGYANNAGVNGTWVTTNNDPQIPFFGIDYFENVSGAYVELESALSRDISVQVFYATSSQHFSESNSKTVVLKAGETIVVLPFSSSGNYTNFRFDIGSVSGLRYQIKSLGLKADFKTWWKDTRYIHAISEDSGSGVDKWYWHDNTDNLNWIEETSSTNILNNKQEYISYWSAPGRRLASIQACDKAGNCASNSTKIFIDTQAPTIEFGTDGSTSYIGTASSTINVTDEYSGVGNIYYGWSTSSVITSTSATTPVKNSTTVSGTCGYSGNTGDCYLHVWACDALGNCDGKVSSSFKIDRKPPTIEESSWGNDTCLQYYKANFPGICTSKAKRCLELRFKDDHTPNNQIIVDYSLCADNYTTGKSYDVKCAKMSAYDRLNTYISNNRKCQSGTADYYDGAGDVDCYKTWGGTPITQLEQYGNGYAALCTTYDSSMGYAYRACDLVGNCSSIGTSSR